MGERPSKYLPILLKEAETTAEQLRERIEQHHVSYEALAGDDFEGYFEHRRQRLLDLIGKAMGKDVSEPAVPSLPEEYDLEEEEPTDDDVEEAVA